MYLTGTPGTVLENLFLEIQLYTVFQKNVPTLASCSFDKNGPILIIFGQQQQHTVKNDTHI